MQYTYRGVAYNRQPLSLEVTEGEISGTYRGQAWRENYPRHVPELKPKPCLQYRGVAYSKRPYIQTGPRIACQIEPLRYAVSAEQISDETTAQRNLAQQIHLENIRRHLEHRLQVAKEKGDRELIALLQQESQQFALDC